MGGYREARKVQIENFKLTRCYAVQFPRMKGFRRWLFSGLAGVSMALCASTVVFWVLSYGIPTQGDADRLVDPQHHSLAAEEARFYGFDSTRGVLGVNYTVLNGEILPFTGWKFDISHSRSGTVYYDSAPTVFTRMGFHAWGQSWGGGGFHTYGHITLLVFACFLRRDVMGVGQTRAQVRALRPGFLLQLWIRSPRHARQMPGMWNRAS